MDAFGNSLVPVIYAVNSHLRHSNNRKKGGPLQGGRTELGVISQRVWCGKAASVSPLHNMAEEEVVSPSQESYLASLAYEIFTSPLNLFLLGVCAVLVYKILRASDGSGAAAGPKEPPIPKLKRQDITLEQLQQYDGKGEHGRVCVGVNGKIFDVTRGRKFYGPGGPYAAFAGRDATRALATFSVNDVKEDYDDLSDLSSMQMDSVREWEMQFTEKYEYIGKLLRPGEQPTEYSDEEDAKDVKSKKDE